MYLRFICCVLLGYIFSTQTAIAQYQEQSWTLLLLKKGMEYKPQSKDYMYSDNGFYLYKNCMYDFVMDKEMQYCGRLIDIKPDSLYFTTAFDKKVARNNSIHYETLHIHIRQLKKIRFIAMPGYMVYSSVELSEFKPIFCLDSNHRRLDSEWTKVYTNDSTRYEVVPYMTRHGLVPLFADEGNTYNFIETGGGEKYFPPIEDSTYTVRNFIWFTPNWVEKINGIALGLSPENFKHQNSNRKDSLEINGLNIQLGFPFSDFAFGDVVGEKAIDSSKYQDKLKKDNDLRIKGINISGIFTTGKAELHGLNLAGAGTRVGEINGISISGLSTFSFLMKGLCISGLKNRAVEAKGMQIALYNKATKMKGIQIGLWNDNGIRKMPLFNWNFDKN
jgi:hypothetical protein